MLYYIYFSIVYNFNILKRARTHRLHDIEKGRCPQNFRKVIVNISKNMVYPSLGTYKAGWKWFRSNSPHF